MDTLKHIRQELMVQMVTTAPQPWINITIEIRDCPPVTMNIQGTPSLLGHILVSAKDTGFLQIWNDAETIAVPVEDVLVIRATKLTKDEVKS